ncbi:MAG: flagellar hook-associated protein 3 [Spirochaetia bacterium]
MERISSSSTNNDMQFHLQRRTEQMNKMHNKMSTQKNFKDLRDAPLSISRSTRYLSNITRKNRYIENAESLQDRHRIAEGYMKNANDILHRIRELSVQGANDTYSTEDKRAMGEEVNQLLNELVEIANARQEDGKSMFGGDKTDSTPFRVMKGNIPESEGKAITSVEYRGSINPSMVEVSEGSYMENNYAGNRVFWAEHQHIQAGVDARDYTVTEDTSINIDDENIGLDAGDNIHTIISKINDSDAAVKADLDPVDNSLVITSTHPHQIWLKDGEGGSVLQDLGVTSEIGKPPFNLAEGVTSSGGSLFDMVIYLRDRLYEGDTLDIGGSALKGIDMAQNQLIDSIGKLGSQDERLEMVQRRLEDTVPKIEEMNSKETDLDMAEAITDLKMLEQSHRSALGSAARILQPTLLDFLR